MDNLIQSIKLWQQNILSKLFIKLYLKFFKKIFDCFLLQDK